MFASMYLSNELYQEGPDSVFTQDQIEYSVDHLLRLVNNRKPKPFDLNLVRWVVDEANTDPEPDWFERVDSADLKYPILVWNSKVYGWVVVDGMHRSAKALKLGYKTLPAHILTDSEMEIARKK